MLLEAGEIVGDRYRVVKLLGQGGMGAVYRAWDTRLNHPIALKEMTTQINLDAIMLAQLRDQFEQEAQILASLTHPGLVRVTDHFSWQSSAYLVMDFVEGESLSDLIYREGIQSESQVLAWAKQLLAALAYCHNKGVLHRDIKPQNIVVTPEGAAVLVDFGLVKLWNPQDPETRTVMRGAGTPEYAPPEQYDTGAGHTDPRSDIYSVGATLYQALTGQAPPTATRRVASPFAFIPPRDVNIAVSPTIEAVVLKALEIAMEDRFQSADEMLQALKGDSPTAVITPARAVRESQPAVAAVETEAKPAPKPKRGLLVGGVGLVVVVLVCLALTVVAVLAGLYLWRGDGPTDATPVPPTAVVEDATVAPVPETSGIIFQDDFSNSASGWEIGDYDTGDVGYDDGIYFVTSVEEGKVMWGVANRSFGDVVIEVDATQIAAGPESNNGYGVVCRDQGDGDGDGYYLRISGDGFYSIAIAQDGEFESLVEWTSSDDIHQGNASNHIQATCDGSSLSLSVNGQHLDTVEDDTFIEGDIALTATTYEGKVTQVHFDDLVVRAP